MLSMLLLTPVGPVRVLGVDDWSRRKGHDFGTILVDLEARQVVDLLQDRTAATLAAWLRMHPEVEIVSRDRLGAYADGVRQEAPQAIQVADRFHLLKNVTELVERTLICSPVALRAAAQTATVASAVEAGVQDGGLGSSSAAASSVPMVARLASADETPALAGSPTPDIILTTALSTAPTTAALPSDARSLMKKAQHVQFGEPTAIAGKSPLSGSFVV